MKKKIPIQVLEVLQPIADQNRVLVSAARDQEAIFHLIDNDKESDFYFKVIKKDASDSKISYAVEFKPRNKEDVSTVVLSLGIEEMKHFANLWVSYIETYENIQTIFDDPILKNDQQRFQSQFNIVDEDADCNSFDLDKQIYIDTYLRTMKKRLPEFKEGKTAEQIEEINELDAIATEIQMNLTRETKSEVIQRLSYFWAKAQRVGIDVIKEVFVNVLSDLTRKLLSHGL